MELKIKKELRTDKTATREFSPQFIQVEYGMEHLKPSYDAPYVDRYKHELRIFATGQFPTGDNPNHTLARNGLMSYLYSDIIHELHILANEISPRNTDALKRIRQMQADLSSWN
jgi:hypothetical protein